MVDAGEGYGVTDRQFHTDEGNRVPAVTAAEMREVDRIAVEELGLTLLQMMENAGRNLALAVRRRTDGPVTVLAGDGGNGGGGLTAARHLANHGTDVDVVLDRDPEELDGAAAHQYSLVDGMDIPVRVGPGAVGPTDGRTLVDALVGYGLSGPLKGAAAGIVEAIPAGSSVVALDVPTGVDATTGEASGVAVDPDLTVTLALPKTGLDPAAYELLVADIGIPAVGYRETGVDYRSPFDGTYLVALSR